MRRSNKFSTLYLISCLFILTKLSYMRSLIRRIVFSRSETFRSSSENLRMTPFSLISMMLYTNFFCISSMLRSFALTSIEECILSRSIYTSSLILLSLSGSRLEKIIKSSFYSPKGELSTLPWSSLTTYIFYLALFRIYRQELVF